MFKPQPPVVRFFPHSAQASMNPKQENSLANFHSAKRTTMHAKIHIRPGTERKEKATYVRTKTTDAIFTYYMCVSEKARARSRPWTARSQWSPLPAHRGYSCCPRARAAPSSSISMFALASLSACLPVRPAFLSISLRSNPAIIIFCRAVARCYWAHYARAFVLLELVRASSARCFATGCSYLHPGKWKLDDGEKYYGESRCEIV